MDHPQQRIRLLLAIPHLGGGGAERVIALLAQHLDPTHFDTHIVLITADLSGACPLPPHVIVHRLNKLCVRNAWLPLLQLIRAVHPNVILSGMAHLSFLILLLKPFLPRRTRILVRQNTTASAAASHWLTRLSYRHLYPRADRILCQSSSMAEDLVRHFSLNHGQLTVLHNPIIPSPATQSQSEVSSENINLLFIGRLSPEKGADLLLQAFQCVQQRHPQATLTLLGIGQEEPALRNLAAELNLTQSIHFAGHVNPAPCYAAATLFVLPSRYEGIPNALLEAAAAGLPIVATPASGGLVELLQNQPHCWLALAITPEALAEAILTAIASLRLPVTHIQHSFLAPFYLDRAIPAYAEVIDREARPRIAMLIPTLDQIGGAERQLLDLSKELAHRNWQVTVITLSGNLSGSTNATCPASAELTQAKIAHLSLRMRKAWIDPRGWLLYFRWHHRNHPEILHAHLPHASFFARLSRLIVPSPVLIDTIHTSAGGPLSRRLAYRVTNWLSSQVTCVSHAVAASVHQSKSAPNPLVIPNGIAIPPIIKNVGAPHLASEMWDGEPSNSSCSPTTSFRWLSVGRLAPVKDYPTLLRAFAQLPGNPTLTIAGSGPEEPNLRTLAASLNATSPNIDKRIHFAGFQPEIQPLLAAADAFVLASLWEGLPISILEASAAGLPIVATDAAGTREALIPDKTGLLVPVGDHLALAAAMTALQLLTPVEREAIGQAGRTFVETNYSLGEITNRWEQLYRKHLSRS